MCGGRSRSGSAAVAMVKVIMWRMVSNVEMFHLSSSRQKCSELTNNCLSVDDDDDDDDDYYRLTTTEYLRQF